MTGIPTLRYSRLESLSSVQEDPVSHWVNADGLCYLKLARFAFEIPWLSRESGGLLVSWHKKNSNLGPSF